MKKERKELTKMDHYEEYTDEEKAQIKDIFQKVADLNTVLDKYDIEVKFDWADYLAACSECFDYMGS